MTKEQDHIIIATKDIAKALKIFFNKAPYSDEITIQYTNQFIGLIEQLTEKISKGAGWIPLTKGVTTTTNDKCLYNQKGYCTNKEKTKNSCEQIKCTESKRLNCKQYEQENKKPFKTNYITLSVVGQVRSLRK